MSEMPIRLTAILGADISKNKFDVALLKDSKIKNKVFENNQSGFQALTQWLARQGIEGDDKVHACMEATGTYGEALSLYLADQGHVVSVVNPVRIKGFGISMMARTKTDKSDARVIARFCEAIKPAAWTPPTQQARDLQALVRRLHVLQEILLAELNRMDVAPERIKAGIAKHITWLEQEIANAKEAIRLHIDDQPALRVQRDLLDSIPGVGEATINAILSMFISPPEFESAREFASHIGVAPKVRQSGTWAGKTKMCKTGDARLRKALYMPAVVSLRHNPVLAHFAGRLAAAGKPKMVIVGAVMRKLAHIIYGVLKSGKPFDVQLAMI
jgi:transposase